MVRLSFTKMQAVGNDFVVVQEAAWPADTQWHKAAVFLCDRKFGIGSDGLLVVGPSQVADVRMRMFNPDGTEDMCGNGLRCIVRRAFDTSVISENSRIETLAGVRAATVHEDNSITTEMGSPQFSPLEIPLRIKALINLCRSAGRLVTNIDLSVSQGDKSILFDAVNTGSTHAVIWENALSTDEQFFYWSPFIETNTDLFPERTSVMWAVVEGSDALRLRIWERGAGETLGCGTGACAAAVLARKTSRLSVDRITVHSKGGTLHVSWAGGENDPMFLTGTAHTVYDGKVDYKVEYPHAQT